MFFMVFIIYSCKEKDEPYPAFSGGSGVYIVGGELSEKGYIHAALWKDGKKYSLDDDNADVSAAYEIFVTDNDVYIVGAKRKSGKIRAIFWKNGKMHQLSDKYSVANDVYVVGNDVYISGYSTYEEQEEVVTLWKNAIPQQYFGKTFDFYKSSVYANKNDVYVGCHIYSESQIHAHLFKNGENIELEDNKYAVINEIVQNGDDIYLAGAADKNNNVYLQTAAYWKNGIINYLSGGEINSFASDIFINNNDVYTVGNIWNSTTLVATATMWKNETPQALSDARPFASANSISINNNIIYIIGYEEDETRQQFAKYWIDGVSQDVTNSGHKYFYSISVK